MHLRRKRLWFLIFLFFSVASRAQQSWPHTLLWRISGKGLTHPSYLYGTMHLQDRRLFRFGDSLYAALEQTEGFAMEIDFQEFIDSLFSQQVREAQDRYLDEEEDIKIDRRKLGRPADSLLRKLGIRGDRVSRKDLRKIREQRIGALVRSGEMPTIVDGYLYGLALRHRKWTGGIEDVQDQLPLLDELGGELTPEQVFMPEAELRRSLEEMIGVYVSQDLVKLARLSGADLGSMRDAVLLRRNVKMARRMDSLSALRSTLFAVGAAHLPGDSGVIALLRARGFRVDPVFSSRTLEPEDYSRNLQSIPWSRTEDEEGLYSVEMPGVANSFSMFGQAFPMKMFFDITSMTFYMAGRGIGRVDDAGDVDRIFANMAERMGVNKKQIRKKSITEGAIHGAEGSVEADQGAYRFRVLQKGNNFFMLMVGAPKKQSVESADATRFFSSFQAKDVATGAPWQTFRIPEKGFSVELPGMPRPNLLIDSRAQGSSWHFTTYDYVDKVQGLYYFVQVRDIDAGYYIPGDSAYFESYRLDLQSRFDSVLNFQTFLYEGLPACQMEAWYKQENAIYKMMFVVRGNRVYSLMAGAHRKADFSDVARYFHSLRLEPYRPSDWKTRSVEGFATRTPAEFLKKEPDTTDAGLSHTTHYIAYDTNTAISYEILRAPLPRYYWAKNDSSFFAAKVAGLTGEDDSVIQVKPTVNGGLASMDLLLHKKGSGNLRKFRLLVSGDSLYTLISFIPLSLENDPSWPAFFDSFRLAKEVPPAIYHSHARELLEALASADSATAAEAEQTLSLVNFTREDLPYLQEALLHRYDSDLDAYSSRYHSLIRIVKELADSGTVQFIQRQYPLLTGERERLKYPLLEVLANIHTASSYAVLKELLLHQTPVDGQPYWLGTELQDSLARTLFPDLLVLSRDSLFATTLIQIAGRLIDSNWLSIQDLLPYRDVFQQKARRALEAMKKVNEETWRFFSWIYFIGRFNDKEGNDLLRQFFQLPQLDLQREALEQLLKNDQPLSPAQLQKLAADRSYRSRVYALLKLHKRLSLFPAAFANQKSLAESELYSYLTEEYEYDGDALKLSFVGERIEEFEGKKSRFFLFRLDMAGEDAAESRLGVTGPYPLASKELYPTSDATGITDESFEKNKLEQQLRQYLKAIESYQAGE